MAGITCLNCGSQVEQSFCPACGQKATTGKITLGGLLKDLPHAVFHVDKGFLFNIVHLIKRPGPAIIDFLNGKRKAFFHPATFLVLALVLNYIVVKITDLHFYDEHELITMAPVEAQAIRDYDAMQWWFLEHTYLYILVAIPMSALFVWGLMTVMRESFNLAESAVIILFIIAEGVLIQSTIYALFGWIESGPFRRGLETANLLCLITYASYALFQTFSPQRPALMRTFMAIIGGVGLTAVWIAGALILYYLFG
jgi:hypothetical protein